MKTLKDICKYIGCKDLDSNAEVTDLAIDSRLVSTGTLFIAKKGTHVNGLEYVKNAAQNGAVAVLYPEDNVPKDEVLKSVAIPFIKIPGKKSLGAFASWFYDEPSKNLKLIGVTGTNGKSTTTQLIAQWLTNKFHIKCAVLGTLGYGFLPNLKKSSNTTLDEVILQKTLSELLAEGARYAVLEVSSIGVCEGRLNGCTFAAGAYTNLSRDHLDYHKTMENYANAKESFLRMVEDKPLSINVDDEVGYHFASIFPKTIVYSTDQNFFNNSSSVFFNQFLWVRSMQFKPNGISMEIESTYGNGKCTIGLLGAFNAENFACALSVMLSLGFPMDSLLDYAPNLKAVEGRIECFAKEGKPHIIVDYAHTPDGVEKLLKGVREHHPDGKIICVIGCGGDRDKGKRPIMAIKASVYSDLVVFTSDNPRTEDPEKILDDMERGISAESSNYVRIADRHKAIVYAFDEANVNDCVVIAGKGHEDYQIFKDKTIHFSDREEAMQLLGETHD